MAEDKKEEEIEEEPVELSEEAQEVADDRDGYANLESLSLTEGGKQLIKGLEEDVVSCVDYITNNCILVGRDELVSKCLDLKTKLNFLRSLTRSSKNKALADEALKELVAK